MTTGNTYTDILADSLDQVLTSARLIREYPARMPGLVEKHTLGQGTGLSWREISLAQITASSISESTEFDNPQQLSDTLFSITPSVVGIETLITDRVRERIAKASWARVGALAQNGIQRQKDSDGLTVFGGASTTLAGAGTTLTAGHIAAAVYRISSNTTEPANPPFFFVGHGFQLKDLWDEITAGIGTYPVPTGMSGDAYRQSWRGSVAGADAHEDGNITIDSNADAGGGVFAKEAIVLVQGRSPWIEKERKQIGGGAWAIFHYDEYAYGERSSGNWLYRILSDATNPTS
jgi:hypothetical protein